MVFEKEKSDCQEENLIMTGDCYEELMSGYLLLKGEEEKN
jgi:hypothetical protein